MASGLAELFEQDPTVAADLGSWVSGRPANNGETRPVDLSFAFSSDNELMVLWRLIRPRPRDRLYLVVRGAKRRLKEAGYEMGSHTRLVDLLSS